MKTQKIWKKLLASIMMVITIMGQFSGYHFTSNAKAITGTDEGLLLRLSRTNENAENKIGYGFGINQNGGNGKVIWSFINGLSGEHITNIYCMKADYGDTWQEDHTLSVRFNKSYELPLAEITESSEANSILKGEFQNELLWIIDNMYIPGESTERELKEYLKSAGIKIEYQEEEEKYTYTYVGKDYIDIVSTDSYYETITKEDILAIQQAAIWYFTNYYDEVNGEKTYDKLREESWLQFTTDGTDYNELLDIRGSGRGAHAVALYNYIIDQAKAEAAKLEENEVYELKNSTARLWISLLDEGTDRKEQPIIEVHKLPEFDLALRKRILSVTGEDDKRRTITNIFGGSANRQMNVDAATLNTETTATYEHRKDPVVVRKGDIVKYEITIYNEGSADGYASIITDQLPGTVSALKLITTEDVTSSTGNVYEVRYTTTTNEVSLVLKSETPITIPAYDGETLSSETIYLECEVLQEPDQERIQVLTNIAYIMKAYNSQTEEYIYTEQVGADRDSAPGNYPIYRGAEQDSKQDGVTYGTIENLDYGYTGNAENPKDLSKNETYYRGKQDDDDFEKIAILPLKDITVEKVWDDKNNQDKKRPASIDVTLYADEDEVETVTLSSGEDGIWAEEELRHTWIGLRKYLNGKEIIYTVDEANVPEGYTKKVEGYTITNSYAPETTEITVTKVWNDKNNQDGKRGEYEVTLTGKVGDTKVYEETKTFKPEETTYRWTDLAKYSDGQEIMYTVDETKVPEGYEKQVAGYTITNSYTPETTEITVTKVWEDKNNQDGKRTEYEVTLIGIVEDTKVYEDTKTFKPEDTTYTWTDLAKYSNGKEITYIVDETKIPEEYVRKVEGYTITNTYEPETIQKEVIKIWNDNNNQDGKRAEYEVTLTGKVGEDVVFTDTQKLESYEEKYIWTGLAKYSNGQEIVYTVDETKIPEGYEKQVEGYTITNSYTPETTEIGVTKVWDDNNNQDGIRPISVYVTLYADGEKVETVTLTSGEDEIWSEEELKYIWTDLPKYSNGEEIVYTVDETKVPEGYTYNVEGYVITNKHIPEKTEVIVEKKWDDSNNKNEIRPNSIKVQLYANGKEQGNAIELKESNKWKYIWADLDKKENGKDIEYVVKELSKENLPVEEGQRYNGNYVATYEKDTNKTVITNKQVTFDLKLIKFITAVNEEKTENRVLNVDTIKLGKADEKGNIITTADYILEKNPVAVKIRDFVTYTFRIYNEGDYDGYATEISEDIPEGLEFIAVGENGQVWSWDGTTLEDITEELKNDEMYDSIINTNSIWGYNQNSSIIKTTALENELIKGFGQENVEYADKENKIDYKEISVIFRVKENVKSNEIIRNEAAISQDKAVDKNGNELTDVLDRDSEPEKWEKEESDKKYDQEGKWPIYAEDEEDYDNIVTKSFDLSLRKQIVKINNALYTQRFAKLDANNEHENTLYNYYDVYSEKPNVKAGDIVTYSIRVYNEGEIDGYASIVVDKLPSGLEFLEYEPGDGSINDIYGWTLSEGTEDTYQTDYLSYEKDSNKGTSKSTILKAYTGEGEASYQEIYIECKVKEDVTKQDSLLNVAQIAEDSDEKGKPINDKDSKPGRADDENKWKVEDDLDIEILQLQEFDLALRKFITQIENGEKTEEVTTRIPQVSYDEENKKIVYTHTKDALVVHVGDTVIYTLRVYNEGEIDGYASEIKDDIPEYLEYLPKHETNIENEWVMYDKDGNVTENVEEAVCIRTEHLAKGHGLEDEDSEGSNLIKAFDPAKETSETNPDYKEIQVAFKVKDPNSTEYEIVNFAQISEDTDKDGNPVKDKDSTPDNGKEEPKEDDEDIEKVKVEYFDLSLLKYVTKVFVNENGAEKIIETGNVGDEKDIIPHVQIDRKNINKSTIKFAYTIQIKNEGQIAGEATEITDYVPEGLIFVAEDNEHWTDEGNNVISTKQLEGTILEPGETAQVEVILRWINGQDNFGEKTNIAEISEDRNEENVPDKDSTPDNKTEKEDDIDNATVLLSVNQGGGIQSIYINLTLVFFVIILAGGIMIKKFVL